MRTFRDSLIVILVSVAAAIVIAEQPAKPRGSGPVRR